MSCLLKTECWVRPPGSHPVTLTERDHLLGFKRTQTEHVRLLGEMLWTPGDQRPTFPVANSSMLMMGVVINATFAGTFGYSRHRQSIETHDKLS